MYGTVLYNLISDAHVFKVFYYNYGTKNFVIRIGFQLHTQMGIEVGFM